MEEVVSVHERLEFAEEFGFRLTPEDGLLNWSTMTYPSKEKEAIQSANEVQEVRQAKLLDELNAQKDNFDRLLERFAEDLAKCKALGDYDMWEESSGAVNELYDGLQAAKATVADFNAREAVFKFPPTEYPSIDAVEKDLDPCFKHWRVIRTRSRHQSQ
jgi:dynein heavy chain, axonemal